MRCSVPETTGNGRGVQLKFLEASLQRVKKEKFAGAVLIAVHHPLPVTSRSKQGKTRNLKSDQSVTDVLTTPTNHQSRRLPFPAFPDFARRSKLRKLRRVSRRYQVPRACDVVAKILPSPY
jgi:hypothetical protein